MSKEPNNQKSEPIFKILTAEHWTNAQELDFVPPMEVDLADGYMHFSTARQLGKTLELYFAGQNDVVVLAIDSQNIAHKLKWEPSRGGDLFPHLYGRLDKSEIVWHETLNVSPSGECDLPVRIKDGTV